MAAFTLTSCEETATLSVDPVKVYIGLDGGNSENIDIKASGDWTATAAAGWATVTNQSGTGDAQIVISAEAAAEDRQTTVTVSCGDESVDITVYQTSDDNILF